MFTINNAKKTISTIYREKHYVVGFSNQVLARHVQYNLPQEPIVYITKKDQNCLDIDLEFNNTNLKVALYASAELYIQKTKYIDDAIDSILYSPYHLDTVKYEDFMCYPIDKMLGIVLPEEIIEEDEDLMVLHCQVIDPLFIPEYYKKKLTEQYL